MLSYKLLTSLIIDFIVIVLLIVLSNYSGGVYNFFPALYICVRGMLSNYTKSRDYFNLLATFYTATLVFVVIPGLVFYFDSNDGVWQSPVLVNLAVDIRDILRALHYITLSLISFYLGDLVSKTIRIKSEFILKNIKISKNIWYLYIIMTVMTLAIVTIQSGNVLRMLRGNIVTTDLGGSSFISSGLFGLILSLGVCCAYRLSLYYKLKFTSSFLFLPYLLLAILSSNRGIMLTVMLILLVVIFRFRGKFIFPGIAIGYFSVVYLANILLSLRQSNLSFVFTFNQALNRFNTDTIMLPAFSLVLARLLQGKLNFSYGQDIIFLPLMLLPRFIWPGKPLPLDFRINSALNLGNGDVFGTPISIFGGLIINFGIYLYPFIFFVFAITLHYLYSKIKHIDFLRVVSFAFVIDIVRVGDLSREIISFIIWIIAFALISKLTTRRSYQWYSGISTLAVPEKGTYND